MRFCMLNHNFESEIFLSNGVPHKPALALDLGAITLLKACDIPALYLNYTYNRSSLRAWISTRLIRYAFVPVTGFENTLMLYKTWSSISASIGRSANTFPVE